MSGLGTPSAEQPDFAPARPAGSPPAEHPIWPTPSAPPPSGRGPEHPRRPSRTRLVAAIVAAALLLVALLSALTVAIRQAPTEPSPTAPATWVTPVAEPTSRLVTVTPSPVPSSTRELAGGGIGTSSAFTLAGGSGEVRLVSAHWATDGDATPPAGEQYLVIDVAVRATSGSIAVDALSFLAVGTDGSRHQPGFGPALERPFGGRTLAAGEEATGQLGFALPVQAVSLLVLDASLVEQARIELPAP